MWPSNAALAFVPLVELADMNRMVAGMTPTARQTLEAPTPRMTMTKAGMEATVV